MRLIALPLLLISALANAGSCNCEKVIGKCSGAIEFQKSFGSAPNFGAEFKVHSSLPKCSRIEYFVHGTPYRSILINTNQAAESTFGTSPITAKDVVFDGCFACEQIDEPGKSSQAAIEEEAADVFVGHWVGSGKTMFGGTHNWDLTFSKSNKDVVKISGFGSTGADKWNVNSTSRVTDKTVRFNMGWADCSAVAKVESVTLTCAGFGKVVVEMSRVN